MVKPNPWVVSGGILAAFALVIHYALGRVNDALDIW